MELTRDIRYIGVNDHAIDLFEGQYPVPDGMAYNSYVIADEKIAVMDTVDVRFTEEWLGNAAQALEGRSPDYLVVQHMEPDHSASILAFTARYPAAVVVATAKAFEFMGQFYGADFSDRRIVAKAGSTLPLGRHTLHFLMAPMIHWPEVMMSYDSADRVLFSADAFGKFGALDRPGDWTDEARRYYIGIVGKYGAQVQSLLKKAAQLDIAAICPLHGPALRENLGTYIGLYNTWSSYAPEDHAVLIAYTSVYGHTKAAAEKLAEKLQSGGCAVRVRDLARCDMAEAVAEAFRCDRLVLATTTYNMDIFPYMRQFIEHLTERNFQNRTVALIENGSWAPMAAKVMRGLLESCKNLTFTAASVTIRSALSADSAAQLDALAGELCGDAPAETAAPAGKKKFACKLCGYVYEGESLPADFVCPVCGHPASDFEQIS